IAKVGLQHGAVQLYFVGPAFGEHSAFHHAHDARTQAHDEVHVVLDDYEAATLGLVERHQELAQLLDQRRIDAGARLIQQHEARFRHERHGDVDQLLLAIGEAASRQMRDRLQPEELDHLVGVLSKAGVGRREQARGQRAFELLRRDDQVVAHRELAEDLQRLERAANAASRELERRHAGDVLAAELHVARGRPDLAEDGVEERGLAAAVRADHADDLARRDRKAHAIHRMDGAVVLAAILHFEKRSHARRRRSGMESRPPGSQIMSATTASPNITRYQSFMKRSHSGSRMTIAAPSIGPKKRPEPPTITISSIISEAVRLKGAGSMNCTSAAKYAPATPANAAPMAKARSVYAMMLTPRLSARIGLSRSAAKARPQGERISQASTSASTMVDT